MKTYSIRLFPSQEQVVELQKLSTIRNRLWNTLVNMEKLEYEKNKKIIHNYELDKTITTLRQTTDLGLLNSKSCQRVSKEVYSSYQSFFKLIKKDKSARPPKYIMDTSKYHTLIFNQSGWIIKDDIIIINKIPLKFKSHKDIANLNIKEIKVKFVKNKWLCDLTLNEEFNYENILQQQNKVLAMDLGLKNLATCIDNKGNVIIIKNKAKKISNYYLKQIAKINSKLSKKTKYSLSYNKLKKVKDKLYHKKNKQIKQTLHIQSKKIVNMNHKTIVVGDLSVKKLMELPENKYKKTSKSFGMSNINMFLTFLTYKGFASKTDIMKIDERHTTQLNCLTGKLFKQKVELSDRSVKLSDNVEIDRDLNAAINILKRYQDNHLALMAEPLDVSGVVSRFNLLANHPLSGKPICL